MMNRGRGRINIFRGEKDYKEFQRLISDSYDQYHVHIVAYCLMSNHYHLLVCTPHANLPEYMRQINGVYTQIYNRKYKQDGTLFKGRYKAINVQEEFYLMRVIRYIHLNPKKAGIVRDAAKYVWSSHGDYFKKDETKRWLRFVEVMDREWMPGKKGIHGYKQFMNQEDDKEIEEFYRSKKTGFILGKNDYKDEIAQGYIHNKRYYDKEIPEGRKIEQKRMVDHIERAVCRMYGLDEKGLYGAQRGKENEGRNIAIRLIRDKAGLNCKEIAQRYHVNHERSISEYCRRVKLKCERNKSFCQRYRALEIKFAS